MQQRGYFTFGILTNTSPSIDVRTTLPRANEVNEIINLLSEPQTRTVLITGTPGSGKSTLASLVFSQMQENLPDSSLRFQHYVWLKIGPRATWPDISAALLNALQGKRRRAEKLSQRIALQTVHEVLHRPEQGALIVLDQCEELFRQVVEAQNQASPYTVGVGLSSAVRFLEMLQQDLGDTRVLLTCEQSPYSSSDYSDVPAIREYKTGRLTVTDGIGFLQQRTITGLQQDLSDVWQRCYGHVYTLLLFSVLKNLSGLSLHYLLNASAYQILWEGDISQNLIEAVFSNLSATQMSLLRSLSLFRETVSLTAVIAVLTDETTLETTFSTFESEIKMLAALGLIEQNRSHDGEIEYSLHNVLSRYILKHYLENAQHRVSGLLPSSLGVVNQPGPVNIDDEARLIALAAGHMRIANYYQRLTQQSFLPHQQSTNPNEATPSLSALEHLCLGWHWQKACDQLYAQRLDEDLLRWEIWHTLIQLYEMMLPPTGMLKRRDEGLICSTLGMIYGRMGEYEQSRMYYTSALAIQRDMNDTQSEATTLINQGEFLRGVGDIELASKNFEQALTLLTPQGDPQLVCILWHNMGLLAQQQGDIRTSAHYLTQSLSLAQQNRDQKRESLILTNLGLLLCEQGRFQEALSLLLPALQMRHVQHDTGIDTLISFLNKLEEKMGKKTFATMRESAQLEGKRQMVLRALATLL